MTIINSYTSTEDLKAKHSPLRAESEFILEGRHYKFVQVKAKGAIRTRHYRCEVEQHNVYIKIFSDIILDIQATYSINGHTDALYRAL